MLLVPVFLFVSFVFATANKLVNLALKTCVLSRLFGRLTAIPSLLVVYSYIDLLRPLIQGMFVYSLSSFQ